MTAIQSSNPLLPVTLSIFLTTKTTSLGSTNYTSRTRRLVHNSITWSYWKKRHRICALRTWLIASTNHKAQTSRTSTPQWESHHWQQSDIETDRHHRAVWHTNHPMRKAEGILFQARHHRWCRTKVQIRPNSADSDTKKTEITDS